MQKLLLTLSSISGFITVAIGAFGAHALKKVLEQTGHQGNFETGVKYQMFHTLAMLVCALLMYKMDSKLISYAGISFAIGILLFSGSLYILSITGVTKWGMVTPLGGTAFLIGWGMLIYAFIKQA